MKINEVEALVGITKKNIRFYEEQGLLSPRRNSQNGYREYGEPEVELLRQIKLEKAGSPLRDPADADGQPDPWGRHAAASGERWSGSGRI